MAYDFSDSFDGYGTKLSLVANQWDVIGSNPNSCSLSAVSRFGLGASLTVGGTTTNLLVKAGLANEGTRWYCMAFMQSVAINTTREGFSLQWRDITDAQCTIEFDRDGSINVYSGDTFGTLIATWSNAFVANSFDHYQVKVVIHNTNGAIYIKKNRTKSDATIDFQATGLNTRGGSSNNYSNAICIRSGQSGVTQYIKDLFIFNSNASPATEPNDWIGDTRSYPLMPLFDTAQKQFAQNSIGSLDIGPTGNGVNASATAGKILLTSVFNGATPGGPYTSQGGKFTTVSVEFNGGFTGNAKLALYLADGTPLLSDNSPGTLIAVSNALVNPVNGVNTFTFPSPVGVMNGYGYCFGLITDSTMSVKSANDTNTFYYQTTYGAGFPTSLSQVTTGFDKCIAAYLTLTANNAGCVNDQDGDADITFVSDNVVNDYDLYTLNGLNYTPNSVLGVTLKAQVEKSDSSAKGFKIAAKSGSTNFETAEYLPLVTWTNYDVIYFTDPDTSLAWVPAALAPGSLKIGPKVSS